MRLLAAGLSAVSLACGAFSDAGNILSPFTCRESFSACDVGGPNRLVSTSVCVPRSGAHCPIVCWGLWAVFFDSVGEFCEGEGAEEGLRLGDITLHHANADP